MKESHVDFSENPSFNTVTGLTNTIFDPNNIVEGRMATEAQIQELERRYTDVEARRNYCCRDIVVWKTYTRIITSDGIVVSPFVDNVVIGTARRGMPFTVTFSPKWDGTIYEDYRSNNIKTAGSSQETMYSNNFEIRVTDRNKLQSNRELADSILINNTSTHTSDSYTLSSVYDAIDSSNNYLVTHTVPITANCTLAAAETCAPLRTFPIYTTYNGVDGGHFYIYRASDGTITIDVNERGIFRGTQDSSPSDSAFLTIFVLQFVLRGRV